jgi:hypothetical protein
MMNKLQRGLLPTKLEQGKVHLTSLAGPIVVEDVVQANEPWRRFVERH